jgi:hypothetical protein
MLQHKFFKDKDGRVVIFQSPNIPIIVWLCSLVLSRITPEPLTRMILGRVSMLALVLWALLELVWGVNYFRRVFGLVVLASIVVGLII